MNKKIPKGPPSPPAPVLHSPTRKVTVKEQQEWKIPPCISNWKNPKGYTIPLDKRLAADGRGLQSVHINENFSKFAEALYLADRKAREAIEMRAKVEQQIAQKEKSKKEEDLAKLANQVREQRSGIKPVREDKEVAEREDIRKDREKERRRDRAIQRAAPEKRLAFLRKVCIFKATFYRNFNFYASSKNLGLPGKNINFITKNNEENYGNLICRINKIIHRNVLKS